MSLITVNVTLPKGNRITFHGLSAATAEQEIKIRLKGLCSSLHSALPDCYRLHSIPPQVDFNRWMTGNYGFKNGTVVIPLACPKSPSMVYANPWEDEEEEDDEDEEDEEEEDEEEEDDEEEDDEEEDDEEEDEEEEDDEEEDDEDHDDGHEEDDDGHEDDDEDEEEEEE